MPDNWPTAQLPRFLAEGQPCPDSAAIGTILGSPFTPEGVSRYFQGCLAGSHVATTLKANRETEQVILNVSLLSPTGEPAANFMISLIRQEDGSLELHRGTERVEPAFRGQHITDKVTRADIALLRGLSSHPESTMSIRAANYDPAALEAQFGSYVWARTGLFECSEEEMIRLRAGFLDWLQSRPGLTSAQRLAAGQLSQEWRTPYQVARSVLPGRTFPVDLEARQSQCELGKAFLLSDKCPAWFGTCKVNQSACQEARQGLERVFQHGQPLKEPAPPVEPVVEKLWRQFLQPDRPAWQRTRDCADACGLGRRVPAAARVSALHDECDEVRQALATAQFSLLPQDLAGALETAWSLLEKSPGSGQRPLYWERMARADCLRVVLDYTSDLATKERLERLERLVPADPWVRQAVEDAIATLRSGQPQGFLRDTCGDYLEDILQA